MSILNFQVGVDVGGTFTDIFVFDEKSKCIMTAKVPSTKKDQSEGFIKGISTIVDDFSKIKNLVHGSTVGTNALLERRGARTGIITTQGFSDILEMRRRDRPKTWGLKGSYEPIVKKKFRMEVSEEVLSNGKIEKHVSEEQIQKCINSLLSLKIDAVCIFFVNSYANNANEHKAAEIVRKNWPNDFVSVSTEILPEIREFERLSTSVLNAYLQPVVSSYLDNLKLKLENHGFKKDIFVVQSNGGTMSLDIAKQYPIRTTLSGPAAGVIAGRAIALSAGIKNIITCDMGGTSFDVSLITQGRLTFTAQTSIDFGMTVRTPMIEVTTIGAGGGSIASIDTSGLLKIGPESAGSEPGPVCYGMGNNSPTVTDANLVLGRINPERPIGGKLKRLDIEKSRKSIKQNIANKLNLSIEDAAEAILKVANAKMAGAIRLVSIEKGHDPGNFFLMPFGGGGALHTGSLIKEVGLKSAIIPRFPGVTSALGCLVADVLYDRVQTVNKFLNGVDANDLAKKMQNSANILEKQVLDSNASIKSVERYFELDMLYAGQTHTVSVPLAFKNTNLKEQKIKESFNEAYLSNFGRLLENIPIKIINYRIIVLGKKLPFNMKLFSPLEGKSKEECILGARQVYCDGKFWEAKLYDRLELKVNEKVEGPAILEQSDTTIFVDPGLFAKVDTTGNLIIKEKES